ncbi:MAG: PCMD domain-containing protein, partial [Prevotellaceae bacterium]|nr:PCMD domain-containing protein [Prevotellaceae bacterium]
ADIVVGITILNENQQVVYEIDDYRNITEKIKLKVGNYQLVATSGDDSKEVSFNSPQVYRGVRNFSIASGVESNVSVTCSLAYIRVDVNFSDKIKSGFTDYYVVIGNGWGNLIFAKNEERSGYIKVRDSVICVVMVENAQGEKYITPTTVYTDLKGADYLKLDLDVKDKPAPGVENQLFYMEVNQTLNEVQQEFEIPLAKEPLPPAIEGEGFDIDSKMQVAYGAMKSTVVNISSPAKLGNVYLRHKSPELSKLGVPTLVDLLDATAGQVSALTFAGIGFSVNAERQVVSVDFSLLTEKLPAEENGVEHMFDFLVTDVYRQFTTKNLIFYVVLSPLTMQGAESSNVYDWIDGLGVTSVVLKGRWVSLERPENVTFAYKADGSDDWMIIPTEQIAFDDESKTAAATASGLKLKKSYTFKLVSENDESGELRFTTSYPKIQNMNFEDWTQDGACWYPNSEMRNSFWASGNLGSSMSLATGRSATTPESNFIIKGRAARLETLSTGSMGSMIGKPIAAGNLFTGTFAMSGTSERISFGRPYVGRPSRMVGYYCYKPNKSGYDDKCHIYIRLADDSNNVIGYGELVHGETMSQYERFSIDVSYQNGNTPTKVAIVISSSKDGENFKGGVGSILYVDEFDFEFD